MTMNTDSNIRAIGMKALIGALGNVDAGRFLSIAQREKFDYSKWREQHFGNEDLETLFKKVVEFERERKERESVS